MKKTVVCMLIAAMTMGSMVTPVFADGEGDATHIYVLTAPEDHGWTGSVATFAKEKIEEVNDAGTYSAELITSADAAEQIVNIEDIIAAGEDNIAVVIQPIDDTVQSAIQQLVDAEIPYVAFDRIIEGVADSAVSNVKGDNEGIGAACAAYYTEQGLKPGDAVYVYEGDTSSVTTLRDEGFTTKYCIKLIQSATACQIRCISEEFFFCCIVDSAALKSFKDTHCKFIVFCIEPFDICVGCISEQRFIGCLCIRTAPVHST